MRHTDSPQRPGPIARALDRAATRWMRLPADTSGYTITDVRVPARDGIELAAELYRPNGSAAGSLLVRCPYGRSAMLTVPMARIFANRGYNVLFVSSRGTFGSGDTFDPMVTEIDDGRDVVAWMRDQPWYTGTFGTVGGSYLGFTQWALLTEPPEDLVAAVISVGPHDTLRSARHTIRHGSDGGSRLLLPVSESAPQRER